MNVYANITAPAGRKRLVQGFPFRHPNETVEVVATNNASPCDVMVTREYTNWGIERITEQIEIREPGSDAFNSNADTY
jgi:hypothetical protein